MKVCPAAAAVAVFVAVVPQATSRSIIADADDKAYPISKVVTLLKDMGTQLQKEGEEDEEVYDKMACWCTTNDKDKTKTIEDAEAHIADLGTTIEATTAQSARLNTEIENHEADLAKAQKALNEATSLRERQLADFTDEEKDLLQSIGALKSALVVLSKHHSSAAVLLDTTILNTISGMMKKHHSLLQGKITPHQRREIFALALVQAPSYTPASGEIFGILNQMKETFESNLAATQKEALGDQKQYEDLKSAKEDEVSAITSSIEEKKVTLAGADEKNAQAKEDLTDTQNGLTADETFLIDLKKRCSNMDAEWETRQRMRQEEQTAIAKAISILASDEAHDNFSKTFNPSFLQRGAQVSSQRRSAAVRVLSKIAAETKSSNLAALVAVAQLDAFVEVKAAIDRMVGELQEAKTADIKHKDSCISQLNENQRFTEQSEREQSDLQANIDALTATIGEVTAQVETLKSEISEMHTQMKRAGEDREIENKDFQQTVNDQRETQKLLNKALSVLKGVYAKKGSFLQDVRVHVGRQGPPPPEGFGEYKKAGGAGGVLGLLQQIIQEAKHMEAEAIRDEDEAQQKYEGFVKETNNSVETKGAAIVNKNQDKADTEQSLTQANSDHASETTELETLSGGSAALHQSCDFLMKNFDLRMQGFDQEVEALQQAKAILSGMASDEAGLD